MGNQEWTIQRHWKHWSHKTQDEDKRNTTTQDDESKTYKIENLNTTQHRKLKKMYNMSSTKNRERTDVLDNCKQFLSLIRHSLCHSYSQDVMDTTI